ncbi:hypothetical protein V3Q90_15800 [Flavobacterium oreochromis]|uniref:Uncharacterized protein n=1 Tax=Flavobacterium oreochromis TaxID=2906078 RepID=A0ABW8PD12_9FLAO|nr:hypothetical protein [Flavobacterium oreochromis]
MTNEEKLEKYLDGIKTKADTILELLKGNSFKEINMILKTIKREVDNLRDNQVYIQKQD